MEMLGFILCSGQQWDLCGKFHLNRLNGFELDTVKIPNSMHSELLSFKLEI